MTLARHAVCVVSILVMVGCSSSDDELLGSDEQAQTTSFEAVYSVPVDDPSLEAFADYPVRVAVQTLRSGRTRMHYALPRELVGTTTKVDFVGPGDGARLTGRAGTASCDGPPGQDGVVCLERFAPLEVDLARVDRALVDRGASDEERAARLLVSERFGIDPIGVLRFPTRAPRRP